MLDVTVDGGVLAVARWGPADATPVVAAHGITSSSVFWSLVGQVLADRGVRLLAPDLRGRGLSAELPGPSSIAGHGRDLLAVLDHLGLDRAVVVGHSMGGFVAAVMAVDHPDRVAATVLVDGGPPLVDPPPQPQDVETTLHAIIGPSLDRLRTTFDSRQAYRDFWRAHPSFTGVPGWLIEAYADHDAVAGADGRVRSRVVEARIIEDARDTLAAADVASAVARITGTVRMLVAERGMLDGPQGLYAPERLRSTLPDLPVDLVPDTNHFTIGLAPSGARAIADAVEAML